MTEPSGAVEAVAAIIREYNPKPCGTEWPRNAAVAIVSAITSSEQEKLEKAMGEALILIDEINKRSESRYFYGIGQSTHAKLCTIRATLQVPLARIRPERSPK